MKFVSRCMVLCFCALLLPKLASADPGPASLQAVPAAPQLSCAVEWRDKEPDPAAVCAAIGRTLGREVRRVDDARAVQSGDSVQVLDGDVSWITVWLRNGKVRAFTRVSKTLAQGQELAVISRAVKAISRTSAKPKSCVRVEPNGGRKMRSPDLVYPWAELGRCKTQITEVPDPWSGP